MLDINFLKVKQRELDKIVAERVDSKPYKPLINKRKLALLTELGEMFNERPDVFKFWKLNAVIDQEAFKEEFIDVLHFSLSLDNHIEENSNDMSPLPNLKEIDFIAKDLLNGVDKGCSDLADVCVQITGEYFKAHCKYTETTLLLGRVLGITYDEMHEVYMRKNKKNIERQNNNY